MSQRQKLVLVANDVGGPGGMETHLEEMIDRLKHKYSLTIIASSMRIKDKAGVRFIRVPVLRKPFPLMIVMFSVYASLRLIRLRRNSIVHTTGAIVLGRADLSTIHFCHAGWLHSGASAERARPSLLHRLNSSMSVRMKLWFERHCYNPTRTRLLVAVSRRVAKEVRAVYPYTNSAVSVISNGVDTNRFHPAAPAQKQALRAEVNIPVQGTYVVFVGGDWERKGVRYLLEAYQRIAEQYPELNVLVVGNGDIDAFERNIPESLRHRVHFVGRQPNPEKWYRMSDVFVFPSNYEACSLAVLEAAASGLAMVLTRVGGAEDLVGHGVSGYLVERTSDSIASALQTLLEQPEEIERMASAARASVEKLTWDETCRQFEAIYDHISAERDRKVVPFVTAWSHEEETLK